MRSGRCALAAAMWCGILWAAEDYPKPYSAPCTERENVFEFTEKPGVRRVGEDKYEITFAVKGNCDVTVGLVDETGVVVRHLASGVLGANAPVPFQKNSLKQTIYWNGKDDLFQYVKEPGNLKVRVQLGLRPEYDKRLGVTNPKSIPGQFAFGIASDETGVYVATGTKYTRCDRIRKFDHEGNYVGTVNPPPANLPPEKLQGMGFAEYEGGRKELQSPDLLSVSNEHNFLPHARGLVKFCQFAIAGGRIYYCTKALGGPSMLHYLGTDGSTDLKGAAGRPFQQLRGYGAADWIFMAASPDGKWLYFTAQGAGQGGVGNGVNAVARCSLEDDKPSEVLVGEPEKPGSDNSHFQRPTGLDCDGQGRIYVCDFGNNRIQVYAPDGKHQKTIPIDRPQQIKIHRKTGALYVHHNERVQGKSVDRISKLASFDNPAVALFIDCPPGYMALDSYTAKPRIWLLGNGQSSRGDDVIPGDNRVRIWEESGKEFQKFADFMEEVAKEAGNGHSGPWIGTNRGGLGKMVCDPVRERAFFNGLFFDLKTGTLLFESPIKGATDDVAFDKRGYMHCHFNPGFHQAGVGRLDPGQPETRPWVRDWGEWTRPWPRTTFKECPYDYGEEGTGGWKGIIKTMDQLGAKYFQDGMGVNMMGDIVEQCNIYWAPKREEEGESFAMVGAKKHGAAAEFVENEWNATNDRWVKEMEKKGEVVYWIRPNPGIPLMGATAWTFNRNGELRDECAVLEGGLINGVQIDEDGAVYFVSGRPRSFYGKPFLAGQGGILGAKKGADPFTGTLIKTPKKARVLLPNAPIPMDALPARPNELVTRSDGEWKAWIEGAEWLYAGASPIVVASCTCPTMRIHTDWYKRTFVPEQYRHSIGVVDTGGNLILHFGQYGNFDSGNGPESKIPVGGDGIAFSDARMPSGTDHYLCFSDRGERVIVLKLKYQAEESAAVSTR